jgi:hypothetical protein
MMINIHMSSAIDSRLELIVITQWLTMVSRWLNTGTTTQHKRKANRYMWLLYMCYFNSQFNLLVTIALIMMSDSVTLSIHSWYCSSKAHVLIITTSLYRKQWGTFTLWLWLHCTPNLTEPVVLSLYNIASLAVCTHWYMLCRYRSSLSLQ